MLDSGLEYSSCVVSILHFANKRQRVVLSGGNVIDPFELKEKQRIIKSNHLIIISITYLMRNESVCEFITG